MNKKVRRLSIVVILAIIAIGLSACKKEEKIVPPTVKVFEGAITLNYTSANVSAEVTDQGGAEVKSRGFIYGISGGSLDTIFSGGGTGVYSAELSNLQPNTTYVYEAFAKNAGGIGTSDKVTFTTRELELPTVKTAEVENVEITTASCKGNVTNDGGAEVTERGSCWSTNHNPTMSESHVSGGSGLGEYTCNLTNLSVNTKYYVRAYAKNSKGIAYGEEKSFTTMDYGLPEVTTANVTEITQTTAKGGGEVIYDGGLTVTERGICWSSNHNPTVDNHKIPSGEGMGGFTANISSLNAHTKYYVRAYAINSKGTAYGNELNFTTSATLPTVSTGSVTNITNVSALGNGNVTDDGGDAVTERGICWSTNHTPTISGNHNNSGTGIGEFSVSITGLSANTTYYIKAYAINSQGTAYGDEVNFKTDDIGKPTVTTSNVTNITQTTATCGGNITNDGGATITAKGVCWSTSQNPTISGQHTSDSTGTSSFTSSITGLIAGETYYVRAYAINSVGTSYGEQKSFTTNSANKPTITTNNVINVNQTSAFCGGNVTDDGGGTVTARGVCWSNSSNPTISNSHTTDGTGTGSFSSYIIGLTPNTTYYVRAYATNCAGTSYGEQKTFTTSNINLPTVRTDVVTNVTQTSAICGGNVTNDGGGTVTRRGLVWSTHTNPTLSDYGVNSGTGTGSFTANMTGLSPGTTYYVRAFAVNGAGTAYGAQKSFTTGGSSVLDGWLYYGAYNNHHSSWGLTNGGTKEWAVMFPTSILSQYAGTSITTIHAYIGETGSYTLKIYKGGTSQPTTLVKTQSFTVTSTGWKTIYISPITLVTSSTLWVSITTTHNAGQHPAGSCAGVNNPNARWNNDNGAGWTDVYNSNGNVDLCWEIQVYVTNQAKGEKGLEIPLPQTPVNPQQGHEVKVSQNSQEDPKKYK